MTAVDAHEWLSFDDPEGDTWLFDVSFLTSNWSCIWDRGCPGVGAEPAPERQEGCCSHGAHFSDDADLERVVAAAARLDPAQWQHHCAVTGADAVTAVDESGARITELVDGACIFLNRPGFAGGAGCALHRGAIANGEPALAWKPEVCWQLPLRLEFLEDDNGHTTFTVREWKRRDWGSGGDEFHWWCTEDSAAFVGVEPVYVTLADELRALIGDGVYEVLAAHLDGPVGERVLPHPVLRHRVDGRR